MRNSLEHTSQVRFGGGFCTRVLFFARLGLGRGAGMFKRRFVWVPLVSFEISCPYLFSGKSRINVIIYSPFQDSLL